MTTKQHLRLLTLIRTLAREWPDETVAEWAERNIIFREPGVTGPFSLHGRRYIEEPLNLWKGPAVRDLVLCWSARSGKTRLLLCGAAWRLVHHPMRCLWTKPALQGPGGARNDAHTKWLPMIQASPALAQLLPRENRRNLVTTLQQCIAGSIIDWTGTGSAKQLAGNPCDVTIQDEVDGYVHKGDVEAHPSALIDERTKDCPLPMRIKTSTPTVESGLIWQWMLRSDVRRRFVPCPHCNPMASDPDRFFVIGWSEDMDILPQTDADNRDIPVAYVRWENQQDMPEEPDPEDVRIAQETAHIVCPFCERRIGEEHKLWMDEHGQWRPTARGMPGVVGYHLPSLYVNHPETSWGRLVAKFLLHRRDPEFLRNFVNADLALPWVEQGAVARSVVAISREDPTREGRWTRLMTVDCQQVWPYFWYVIRAWRTDGEHRGNSVLIAQGSCDTWEELDAIRQKHDVPNAGVMVDSGFGAMELAEVYRECFKRATRYAWKSPSSGRLSDKPLPGARVFPRDGWLAAKGFPSRKRWRHKSGQLMPYRLLEHDPFRGTDSAGKYGDYLFEFAGDYFLDILDLMRRGRSVEQWSIMDGVANREYWRQMDGKVKDESGNWKRRSRHVPDHLCDCEKMQVAFAFYLGLLRGIEKVGGRALGDHARESDVSEHVRRAVAKLPTGVECAGPPANPLQSEPDPVMGHGG